MAFGTGIALLPERAFSFALAKLPAEAAATTVGAAAADARCSAAPTLSAQAGMGGDDEHADVVLRAHRVREADAARNRLHLRRCGHTTIAECRKDPCGTSHEMRGELAALIDQGKNHDEIIQAFIAKYGSEEMLGAPIDQGFNRLAWLFPYLVGATRRGRGRASSR